MADSPTARTTGARSASDTDLQFERITRGFAVPTPGEPGAGRASALVDLASGIALLAGLWLAVAPWVMGYTAQAGATWNDVAVGATIVLLALCRMLAPLSTVPLSAVNVVLGVWMIVAPWLPHLHTGVTTGVVWNQVITGIVVGAFGVISAAAAVRGARVGRA